MRRRRGGRGGECGRPARKREGERGWREGGREEGERRERWREGERGREMEGERGWSARVLAAAALLDGGLGVRNGVEGTR